MIHKKDLHGFDKLILKSKCTDINMTSGESIIKQK